MTSRIASSMTFFAYRNGEMHAEGVALAAIAAQVGTPFYCYSAGAMRAVAAADYSVATDLADWLVRQVGLPFRQAHHVTGALVGIAAEKDVPLDGLTLQQMQTVEPKITRDVFKVLTVEASVAARKSLGGTAPANVARAVQAARQRFLR